MNKIIELKNVNKWFGKFQVLKDINLSVSTKEKIVICGPSGSGKSTLIRCINRLEEHQEGEITVDGIKLDGNTKNIDKIRSEKHVGANTPIALPRKGSANASWRNGGALYAPPVR